jgi:UDP-4-keto-D-QuiNAc 4-reductase
VSRFLVTGASGFVGAAVCRSLLATGADVRGAVRQPDRPLPPGVERSVIGAIGSDTDWAAALAGVDCVIHLAARVHHRREDVPDPSTEYRQVNTQGTARLAEAAARAGVRRLVFVSTAKVLGEGRDAPYTSADPPRPEDPYALSKWEAEQALWHRAGASELETVILRPPLVYGPGVRANFLGLMRAIDRGLPLPLGAVRNRRSLLFLDNLVEAIQVAATHPGASGRTYLLSDGEDLSTPELVRRIAVALDRPVRLVAVPPAWLRLAARLVGQKGVVDRLLGSLAVESSEIRRELGWSPKCTVSQGLARTATWFRETHPIRGRGV